MSSITIRHSDGRTEKFSPDILKKSFKKARLNDAEIDTISAQLHSELPELVTTKELYTKAHALIGTKNKKCAQLYSLKRALQLMGPSGFPFEHLIGELFKHLGYDTISVGSEVRGKCVPHEIDVLAQKPDGTCALVECKFHKRPGLKSTVKTALYVKARYDDISSAGNCSVERCTVVTNTSFTSVAIDYGNCAGIEMISWDYPVDSNLQDLIEKYALYPITVLTELSAQDRRKLFDQGIVLCKEVVNNQKLVRSLGISESVLNSIDEDCRSLCTV